jgi:hypothetical protein
MMKKAYKIFIRNLKERDHLDDLGLDGRITLKFMLRHSGVRMGFGVNTIINHKNRRNY